MITGCSILSTAVGRLFATVGTIWAISKLPGISQQDLRIVALTIVSLQVLTGLSQLLLLPQSDPIYHAILTMLFTAALLVGVTTSGVSQHISLIAALSTLVMALSAVFDTEFFCQARGISSLFLPLTVFTSLILGCIPLLPRLFSLAPVVTVPLTLFLTGATLTALHNMQLRGPEYPATQMYLLGLLYLAIPVTVNNIIKKQ